MGFFDSLGGSLFGGADPGGLSGGGAEVSNSFIAQQNFLLPFFGQLFQAAFTLGKSLEDLLGDAIITDKKALKQAGKSGSFSILPFGKGKGLDMSKLLQKAPQIFQDVQDVGIKTFQTSFDKLSKVPALADIFDQAGGGANPLQGNIDAAFGQLGEFALGASAKTGLLNNPLVQAKALAPLALDKAKFELGFQQSKLAQALGLAGVPGLAGSNPIFNQGIPSAQSFVPGIAQAASTSLQGSMANQQAQLQASMFNTQMGQDLFGTMLGFGTFAGAGGFSGKGFFGSA